MTVPAKAKLIPDVLEVNLEEIKAIPPPKMNTEVSLRSVYSVYFPAVEILLPNHLHTTSISAVDPTKLID